MLLADLSIPEFGIDKVQIFVLLILPGVVVLKVYDLFAPPQKRDFGNSVLEAMAFGIVNFAVWSWLLLDINPNEWRDHLLKYIAISAGCLVLFPAFLGWLIFKVRNWKWVCQWIGYPNKTAWDDFFKRKPLCYVLCSLKNGKKIGGYFGENSYATTFPDEQELYLEEVWRVDENSCLADKVEGSLGVFIRPNDCDLIEFILPISETPEEKESVNGTRTATANIR
jgi:hypothetical protein